MESYSSSESVTGVNGEEQEQETSIEVPYEPLEPQEQDDEQLGCHECGKNFFQADMIVLCLDCYSSRVTQKEDEAE